MMLRLTVGRAGAGVGAGLRSQHGIALRFHSTAQTKGPVGIFWDIENCSPYNNTSPGKLMRSLRTVFQQYGPIASIRSYQDVSKYTLNEIDRAGYSACGLQMVDTPHLGRKNVADWHIMTDIVGFAFSNPQPATIVVITTDRDYCSLLSMLSNRMYNIVLVTNIEYVIEELASSSSVMYNWKEFLDHASNGQKLNLSVEPPIKPHHTGLDPHWPSTVAHVPKQQRSSRPRIEVMSPHRTIPSKLPLVSPTTEHALSAPVIAPPVSTAVGTEPVSESVTTSTSPEVTSEPSVSNPSSSGLSMENSQGWSSTAFRVSKRADSMYPLISPKIREKYDAVIRSVPRNHHNNITFEELTKQIEQLRPDIVQSLGVSSMSDVIEAAIRDGVLILTNKGPKTHQLKLSRRVYQKSALGAWLIRSGWGNKFDEIKALERVKRVEKSSPLVDLTKLESAEADIERIDAKPSSVIPAVTSVESIKMVSPMISAVSDPIDNPGISPTVAASSDSTLKPAHIDTSRSVSASRMDQFATFLIQPQQDPAPMSDTNVDLSSSEEPVSTGSTEKTDDSLSPLTLGQSVIHDEALSIPSSESELTSTTAPEPTSNDRMAANLALKIPTSSTSVEPNDGLRPNPSSSPKSEAVVDSITEPNTSTKKTRKKKQTQKQIDDEPVSDLKSTTGVNQKKDRNPSTVLSVEGVKDAASSAIGLASGAVSKPLEHVNDQAEKGIKKEKVKKLEEIQEAGKKAKKDKQTGKPKKKKKTVEPLKAVESVKGSKERSRKFASLASKPRITSAVMQKKTPPKSISMPKKKVGKPSSEALAIKASLPSDRPWRILSSGSTDSLAAAFPSTTPAPSSSSSPSPPPSTTSTDSVPDLPYRKLVPPDPARVRLFSSFGVNKRLSSDISLRTPPSSQTCASRSNIEEETKLSILDSSLT